MTGGVLLHLPMFFSAARMHYRLAGMGTDAPMIVGMVLVVAGLLLTAYGLVPGREPRSGAPDGESISIRPLDDAPLSRAHVLLLLVMTLAVVIDVMKPVTLGFVVPGMAKEYGLRSALNPHGSVPVALLPLIATIGTVIGSFVWGSFGDRIGRRASILLAAVLFISTSICGVMPDYRWNFFMCFMMGLAAGGMLPITFALISETMPVRHRGWLMVLIGTQFSIAYILTSWLASALTPHYSWRALWLLGLPTGLLLVLLNRWIPESPRFLLARGHDQEARSVMRRYHARMVPGPSVAMSRALSLRAGWSEFFSRRLLSATTVVCVLGLGVGLVAFGFQLWLPSNLQKLGFTAVNSDRLLRDGALFGLPMTLVLAALYGLWSSRRTIIALALLTVAALLGFVVAGDGVAHHHALLYVLLAIPVTATNSMTAVVMAYGSEVFPTQLRGRGTGIAAGATKAGGVVISALVVAAVAPPSISATALIGAVPLAAAAILAGAFTRETRQRGLEEISGVGLSGMVAERA